jgi:ribosomal protein L11 methyltransferase
MDKTACENTVQKSKQFKMKYKEINIKIAENESQREKLMAVLLGIGYDSFMETEQSIAAYIEARLFDSNRLQEILRTFNGNAIIEKIEDLADQNWNAIWESNYEPVIIENKCMVRAPFHEKPAGTEFDVVIQPKMSFGTAHHGTTWLMIQLILENDFTGKQVLDMGSGTAVLAIMAAMKGAERTTAIDNDEWAYNNAIENCELNSIKNIDVIFGDASSIPAGAYDVVLANINRNILIDDIQHYNKHLKDDASVYLSGFYESDLAAIVEEAQKFGWNFVEHRTRNEWVAAVFRTASTMPESD